MSVPAARMRRSEKIANPPTAILDIPFAEPKRYAQCAFSPSQSSSEPTNAGWPLWDTVAAPLLNFEQEQDLAQRLAHPRSSKDRELARQTLICSNVRLVTFVARRFQSVCLSLDDLIQEGTIGLIQAVDRFDYRQGVRFSTYAIWWIRQAILQAIAEHGALIRVPTYIRADLRRLQQTRRRLRDRLGRTPTQEECAQAMGMTEEQVRKLLSRALSIVSLETPVGNERQTRLADLIPAPEAGDPVAQVTHQSQDQTLREALQMLTLQEREIVEGRYGLNGDEPCSLDEISRARRVSRERIRQIEVRAMQKLRRHLLLKAQAV